VSADVLAGVVNLDGFEALARERMEPSAFAYYAGGAGEEVTLRANRERFRCRGLRPRMLTGVCGVDLCTRMLGASVSMPVGLARAAAGAGVVFCLSTLSGHSIEAVSEATAGASAGPAWFQLYVQKDRGFTKELVARAVAAGCRAIVLTVDVPVSGWREGELRHAFRPPDGALGNFARTRDEASPLIGFVGNHFDASLTWDDLEWIRGLSDLPLVVKGVLGAPDASLAVEHGAAAVVVSNHGGRQLDGSPAALDALVEVVDSVADRSVVLMDGGIRRGTDVLKAIGLGAQAVMVGRPAAWGLAAAGEEGVANVLEILRDEFDLAMALSGCRSVREIRRDMIRRAE
jgi:4-hydroxymandelate oxidase